MSDYSKLYHKIHKVYSLCKSSTKHQRKGKMDPVTSSAPLQEAPMKLADKINQMDTLIGEIRDRFKSYMELVRLENGNHEQAIKIIKKLHLIETLSKEIKYDLGFENTHTLSNLYQETVKKGYKETERMMSHNIFVAHDQKHNRGLDFQLHLAERILDQLNKLKKIS